MTQHRRDRTRQKERLAQLVEMILQGQASPQDRHEAAYLIGALEDESHITLLLRLLEDDDGEVRYYALQALVLDLDKKDEESAAACWKMLTDQDEYVGSMAATCLGSIYSGTRQRKVFYELRDFLDRPDVSAFVKGSVYNALFAVAGVHPVDWPGMDLTRRRAFKQGGTDLTKLIPLESRLI